MTDEPVKLVTPQRVKELFDCYGGSPEAWPEEERSAALALLDGSSELQTRREEACLLDQAMNLPASMTAAAPEQTADLAARILDPLPAQDAPRQQTPRRDRLVVGRPALFDRIWGWSAVALGAAAAAALVIALLSPQPVTAPHRPLVTAANDFDEWVWAQVLDEPQLDRVDRWDNDLTLLLEPGLVPDDG